jgi:hypothetical protein
LLLTEQHPVMQWLAERLMMLQGRGEAPLIASPHLQPGELLFCFIGQVQRPRRYPADRRPARGLVSERRQVPHPPAEGGAG